MESAAFVAESSTLQISEDRLAGGARNTQPPGLQLSDPKPATVTPKKPPACPPGIDGVGGISAGSRLHEYFELMVGAQPLAKNGKTQ